MTKKDSKRKNMIISKISEEIFEKCMGSFKCDYSYSDSITHLSYALDHIFKDQKLMLHDKVAGEMEYEELVFALIIARSLMSEADKWDKREE